MQCRECAQHVEMLTNEHLRACSGLTIHEYAIRHHLPLETLLAPGQINAVDEMVYPRNTGSPDESARAALLGLRWAGLVREREGLAEVAGEVRRLDLLLWLEEQLQDYGFNFRQEYRYADATHRVVASNCLRARAANLGRAAGSPLAVEPQPDFLQALAVFVAHVAEYQAGYIFMPFARAADGRDAAARLWREYGIACVELDAADTADGVLLRTTTVADAQALLHLLDAPLGAMPGGRERFSAPMPQATVSKELVFDAAHFITDHPAKCSNLHGGRYLLHVQVSGRVDPITGCVVDYGYLKRVVNRLVVERFDHHTLNYAAPELAWRSSTEMICVHVWECLVDYLPGLSGLRLYETSQSWCDYRGPSLVEYQADGTSPLLDHFLRLERSRSRSDETALPGHPLRAVAAG